jgi:hypothetical protein
MEEPNNAPDSANVRSVESGRIIRGGPPVETAGHAPLVSWRAQNNTGILFYLVGFGQACSAVQCSAGSRAAFCAGCSSKACMHLHGPGRSTRHTSLCFGPRLCLMSPDPALWKARPRGPRTPPGSSPPTTPLHPHARARESVP